MIFENIPHGSTNSTEWGIRKPLELFFKTDQKIGSHKIIIITIVLKIPMSKSATGQWKSYNSGWIFGYKRIFENDDFH